MYPVSDGFLRAVKSNTRKYYWTGTIVTRGGMTYEFRAKEIVKGSGYISRQCCGSTEIELGTVYAAEMGITLLSDIDRYTLEDAQVTLVFHLVLADDSVEDVPMGVFEVSEANRLAKCLELKAYDFMLRFDKSFNGFETVGTAYDFIALCCKRCKVEFANKRAEIDAMPNGGVTLSVYTENDIETCRDVLFYVAQVLGGFFIINREGKLELRKYGKDPVMKVEQRHRLSSSFSDFITRYTAVSSTNKQTQIAEYYALDPDNGLTMNLGVNPLLQFGLKETREMLCRNILADLSVIRYVPFDSDTIGNPALDPGDVLTFAGGQADEGQITCITSIRQKIGGKQSLKCVGKNPRLDQAKSRNDKNISGLLNQIEDNAKTGKIGIHTFTNASAHEIGQTKVKLISIQFASSEENHMQFFAQVVVDVAADPVERSAEASGTVVIPFPGGSGSGTGSGTGGSDGAGETSDAGSSENDAAGNEVGNTSGNENTGSTDDVAGGSDSGSGTGSGSEVSVDVSLPVKWQEDGQAVCHVVFEFNNEEIVEHCPVETWHSGKHILSLYYPIEKIVANYTNTFNVYLWMEYGSGTVDVGDCIDSVSGQAMAAGEAWDGKLEVEDYTTRFAIGGGLDVNVFRDSQEYLETIRADGYATSFSYVEDCMKVIRQYELTRFDEGGCEAMAKTAESVLDVMRGWLGFSEANGKFREIIDLYNSVKPLPRGYAVQYSDEWCDTCVSAAGIRAGCSELIGRECGVEEHVKIFREMGIWIEDGTITPEPGYVIVYNWDKATQPNDGYSDHIGFVEEVSGGNDYCY